MVCILSVGFQPFNFHHTFPFRHALPTIDLPVSLDGLRRRFIDYIKTLRPSNISNSESENYAIQSRHRGRPPLSSSSPSFSSSLCAERAVLTA